MIKDLRNWEKVRQSFRLIVVYGGLVGFLGGSIIGIILTEQLSNGEFNLAILGFLAIIGLIVGGVYAGFYFIINEYINKNPKLAAQKQNRLAVVAWGIAAALAALTTVVVENLFFAGIIGVLLYAILVCIFGDNIFYCIENVRPKYRRTPRLGFILGSCIGIPIIGKMVLNFVVTRMPKTGFEIQIIFATFFGLILGLICGVLWNVGISLNRRNKVVAFVTGLMFAFILLNIFTAM